MIETLEEVIQRALRLSTEDRLGRAYTLLDTTDDESDEPGAAEAWDAEIRERLRAVEEGRVTGVPLEEVRLKVAGLVES